MEFKDFNFHNLLNETIKSNNYLSATQIQEKVIPLVLQKNDVMAKAQTGSGKTAAFVLPILNILVQKKPIKKAIISTLVLTPTRELALQVSQSFKTFSANFTNKLEIVSVIGGDSLTEQLLDIQKGCDVIVATPGRLLDIISKKQIDLKQIDFFVLDEADKMLDLGFQDELDNLLVSLATKRQNLMFSATYNKKVLDIASKISKNPTKVSIENKENISNNINQQILLVNLENRSSLLRYLLKEQKFTSVLVFMASKRASDNLAAKFRKYGFNAESFHGGLEHDERVFTLEDFKNKKIDILFATDIAARGLHIDNISCVVNYDLPRSSSDYIHRIGRTGRRNNKGTAISFITFENEEHFDLIDKKCELNISKESVLGFERKGTAIIKEKGLEPIKSKRKSKKDKLREKALKK